MDRPTSRKVFIDDHDIYALNETQLAIFRRRQIGLIPTWAPGYTVIGFIDESKLTHSDTVNVAVVLNKVQRSLYSHAEELAAQNNIESVGFNNSLLRFYGVTNNEDLLKTIYSLTGINLAITIIGAVALMGTPGSRKNWLPKNYGNS